MLCSLTAATLTSRYYLPGSRYICQLVLTVGNEKKNSTTSVHKEKHPYLLIHFQIQKLSSLDFHARKKFEAESEITKKQQKKRQKKKLVRSISLY